MTLCLLAKLQGGYVLIPIISSKINLDWKHVKRMVEYVELGNG